MRFDRHFWKVFLAGVQGWLRRWFLMRQAPAAGPPAALGQVADATHALARQQAQALVRAVDAGGLPLHPARVNQIARQLGLEVSSAAPVGETVDRIRAALARLG